MAEITREILVETMRKAVEAAGVGAINKLSELRDRAKPGQIMLDSCGSACIILTIDGRSKVAKLFDSIPNPIPGVSIQRDSYLKGYRIDINPPVNLGGHGQALGISKASHEAALEIIKDALEIDGYVKSYLD